MSSHSEEPAREFPENPDLRHLKGQGKDLHKAGQAPTLAKASLTAGKTVIRWLRWAAVLALGYVAWSQLILVYSEMGPQARTHRPAPLAFVENLLIMLLYRSGPSFLFVAVGAKIAPRARRTTAIVLAAAQVPLALWRHVLFQAPTGNLVFVIYEMLAHPWVINYQHFFLEASGAVLGVVYVFWSEKANGSVASGPPNSPPPR